MHAIASAKRVAYCDTDSVVAEGLEGVQFDAKILGAWKTEAQGNTLYVGGKKLYSLVDTGESCTCAKGKDCARHAKYAAKGLRLTPDEIARVSLGDSVSWNNAAPSFDLIGDARFVRREAKATHKSDAKRLTRKRKRPQNTPAACAVSQTL
jgi:hypothetical protein